MKMIMSAIVLAICLLSFNPLVLATPGQESGQTEKCAPFDPKKNIEFFFYVPKERPKAYLFPAPGGEALKSYVIQGDLLVAGEEKRGFFCAHYLKKGKVVAAGWIKKSEIERFELVTFGAFDVESSQKGIAKANKALAALAKRLPDIKDWRGTAQDKYGNSIKLWRKGQIWQLDPTGIKGYIGETQDPLPLITSGARAIHQYDPRVNDVCDIVIVGFNNAWLATSGSHCMGSGANHEYPSINGIYWKQ